MHIDIPKEIKNHEYRVALTPVGARAGLKQGLQVHAGKITHAGLAQDIGFGM